MKLVLYSFIASYTAATMRYFKQKREGRKPTLAGWFYFGITAFLVTYSFFAGVEYMAIDMPENAKVALGFWVGYMSDYFYSWIPKFIKEKLPTKEEPIFFNNESSFESNSGIDGHSDVDPVHLSDSDGASS